jgi:hypothetical protein
MKSLPRRLVANGNWEAINDRAKLIIHRLIARRLGHALAPVTYAKDWMARQRSEGRINRDTETWEEMLGWPIDQLRQRIVQRDECMNQLRSTSPVWGMPELANTDYRRRIWRKAKQRDQR